LRLPEKPVPQTNDLLSLYRWATQDPDTQAAVLAAIYRRVRDGREARSLREDFAGNAADSVAWVAAGLDRSAIAVDLDRPTIEHATERAQRLLGPAAERIAFHCADVHSLQPPEVPAVDLLSVLNFSIGYLHSRAALTRYLKHARTALAVDGIVVLNLYGGPAAMSQSTTCHRVVPAREKGQRQALPAFDYLWEQRSFDALSARVDCRIHFEVSDVSAPNGLRRIEDAFRYDWRLWTLPELRECLHEAGFASSQIWRHTATTEGGHTKVFLGAVSQLLDCESWVAYGIGVA